MNFLTLDLATNLGWTCGPIPDPKFSFGSHRLPSTGEDIGAFIYEYDTWLNNKIKSAEVYYVVFESPILHGLTNIATLRKLYGLASHTEFVCAKMQIKCREANQSKVKAFMGVRGKGDAVKRAMVASVATYGYQVDNHDIADAIGVRLFTIGQERPDVLRHLKMDLGPLGMAAAQ